MDEGKIPFVERGETLAEQGYSRLREALASGVFQPGESLSIRRLATLLGVSATPARDAIARALWEGCLESGPHRTVSVPRLTLEKLHEIYAVRLNLEGLATELAAPNFNKPVLAKLETIHNTYCNALEAKEYSRGLKANESFHFHIYEQSNNTLLVEMIRALWLKMGPSLNLLYPAYYDKRGQSHHEDILDALRKRDGAKARAALEEDLVDGKAELKRALSAARDSNAPSTK
jgi:DNA-binding GntR family transcriptional regulator